MKKKIRKPSALSVETFFKKNIPIRLISINKRLNASGLCYDPHSTKALILIDKRLKNRRKLNVLIEEVTHAFFWDLPEYKVRKFSAQLGKLIYKLFIKKQKKK